MSVFTCFNLPMPLRFKGNFETKETEMFDLVILNQNNQPTTTSKIIADTFHKVHRDVVRAINNLDIPEDFRMRNFAQSKFKAENVNGVEYDCYEMTRDGFTLLAMGFTGKKAIEWKIKFIEAFRAMENKLKGLAVLPVPVDMKAIGGVVKKCAAAAVRQELTNLLAGEKTENWEVSDQDLIYHLYRWHNTKSKAETLAFRQLHAERDALMAEITQLKEKAQQIKQLAIKL